MAWLPPGGAKRSRSRGRDGGQARLQETEFQPRQGALEFRVEVLAQRQNRHFLRQGRKLRPFVVIASHQDGWQAPCLGHTAQGADQVETAEAVEDVGGDDDVGRRLLHPGQGVDHFGRRGDVETEALQLTAQLKRQGAR